MGSHFVNGIRLKRYAILFLIFVLGWTLMVPKGFAAEEEDLIIKKFPYPIPWNAETDSPVLAESHFSDQTDYNEIQYAANTDINELIATYQNNMEEAGITITEKSPSGLTGITKEGDSTSIVITETKDYEGFSYLVKAVFTEDLSLFLEKFQMPIPLADEDFIVLTETVPFEENEQHEIQYATNVEIIELMEMYQKNMEEAGIEIVEQSSAGLIGATKDEKSLILDIIKIDQIKQYRHLVKLTLKPYPYPMLLLFPKVAAGAYHSILMKGDGTVWTWGNNNYGQLGNGSNNHSNVPVQAGISGVKDIAGGEYHTVALKRDGTVWTWGSGFLGELGNGTNSDSNLPIQVSISGVTDVAGGGYHTVALKSDGTVWTWGSGIYGELGNGTGYNSNVPVQVSYISGVKAVDAGFAHTVALMNDGTVWTWGSNQHNQLGDGTNVNKNTPVLVRGLSGVIAIAAGDDHTMALKSDGTVWTWGANHKGELGTGNFIQSKVPVQALISDVTAIAGGGAHTIALNSSYGAHGIVRTWGANGSGQLGNSTNTDSNVPELANISEMYSIAGGKLHSLAVTSSGAVWAWGRNLYGQLGDGTNTDRNAPRKIL